MQNSYILCIKMFTLKCMSSFLAYLFQNWQQILLHRTLIRHDSCKNQFYHNIIIGKFAFKEAAAVFRCGSVRAFKIFVRIGWGRIWKLGCLFIPCCDRLFFVFSLNFSFGIPRFFLPLFCVFPRKIFNFCVI